MKTTDQIYNEMKEKYAERAGVSMDDGGDMALRFYAVAAELYSLWAQADFVTRQAYPQTAGGQYLDYHAEMRGLRRGEATYAKGRLVFETAGGHITALEIPAGTRCMTAAGVEFTTTENGVIEVGDLSCSVAASACEAGSEGNAPVDSVVFMTLAPVGITGCYNAEKFSGGSGPESDDSLRVRIIASYSKLPNGANAAYYETQALDVPGVAAVSVLPKNRGIGTVDLVISTEGGLPTAEMISEVQAKLEAQREICVSIMVLAPTVKPVEIDVDIACEDGYFFSDVSARVRAAVEAYFTGKLLGKTMTRAKLGDIVFNIEGVANYKINVPAADVPVSGVELPVLTRVDCGVLGA